MASLVRIFKVAVSEKKGKSRQYGKTLFGTPLFPADKDVKLEAGQWAVVTQSRQTMRYDENDKLQEIEFDKQPILHLVQACFKTKDEAVAQVIEEQSGNYAIASRTAQVAKDYDLTPESMLQLANAGI